MCNFFLLNEAVDTNVIEDFKNGMTELVLVKEDSDESSDCFLKHRTIYELNIWNELYSTSDFNSRAIIKFTEQLTNHEKYISNEVVFDNEFVEQCNGFLGFIFDGSPISVDRQIADLSSYSNFKERCLWDIDFNTVWERRSKLFPNLILCDAVENQIHKFGSSRQFKQIISKLKEFNRATLSWTNGNFDYRHFNSNYALNISPESTQTMSKYGGERRFKLPDGRKEFFELHIKTGDLRFHFFPDDNGHQVYVGYIGPHLSTVTN